MVVVRCGDESHEKLEKSETVFSSFSYLVSLSPLSLSLPISFSSESSSLKKQDTLV
jgi:hypothetical protein